jgi:O-antigen/teichoic acid export membrane protein
MAQPGAGRGERFVTNVLWGWLAVGVNLIVGIVLSRYIVRKLGVERYGIWVLVFSILDYLWFFDLGLNTAVTNFCARYLATKEPKKINEVINTA